ncbi:MAG: hypothetical protein QOG19_233, partial [Mycobacterium sp.]|nr:hypothetical protein [Mycobacterium sp.]
MTGPGKVNKVKSPPYKWVGAAFLLVFLLVMALVY